MNKVILVGHVGDEPDMRATSSGTRIARFSLATNRKVKGEDRTEWHRCTVFWERLVDVVEQWVHKGDRVGITGRIEYSTSEQPDGTKRYWTDIVVEELELMGGGNKRPQGVEQEQDASLPF